MNTFRIARHVALAAAVFVGTGCAQWSERTFVRYDVAAAAPDVAPAPQAEKLRPAAEGGLYQVKWLSADGQSAKVVPASARVVPAGQTIGFARAPGGGVVAVAGDERFPVGRPPAEARYLVWATKVPKGGGNDVPTDGLPSARVGRAVGDTVRVALALAVLAALGWAGDCDDDWNDGDSRHHDRHHHGRKDRDDDKPAQDATTGRGAVPWTAPPASK